MKRLGAYKKTPGRILLELGIHLIVALGGIAVFVVSESLWIRVLAILVSTAASMGVGTNTHTSSHFATSSRKWVNEYLTYFGYPLFLGLSAMYWRYKHIIRHHPAPNVMDKDMDFDLMPWFSIIRKQVEGTSGVRRFYYEHVQWLLFPLALAFNGFSMQLAGWTYLIGVLLDPKQRRKAHYIDATAMLLHYVVWILLPLIFFPFWSVILFYVLRVVLMGYAMFAVLAPGHFPSEAACFETVEMSEETFALRQAAASVNFRTGFFGRLVCSGLEFQIEHHLFPGLSHGHYPKIAGIVEEFCTENGYPYRTLGWGEAIWKSLQVFRAPKEVRATPTAS